MRPARGGGSHCLERLLSDPKREVFCFGYNGSGALGNYQTEWAREPQPVPGVTGAKSLTSDGLARTCALLDNEAVCWGDGLLLPYHQPLVPDGVQYAVSSNQGLCAVTSTGAVVCNSLAVDGELTKSTLLASGAAMVNANGTLVCALLTSGGVHCWDPSAPLDAVATTSGATLMKVGPSGVCALVSGALGCWAADFDRLDGPVAVPGYDTATAVALGADMKCALSADGKVGCWETVGTA